MKKKPKKYYVLFFGVGTFITIPPLPFISTLRVLVIFHTFCKKSQQHKQLLECDARVGNTRTYISKTTNFELLYENNMRAKTGKNT